VRNTGLGGAAGRHVADRCPRREKPRKGLDRRV
jgi:hypothetical protein